MPAPATAPRTHGRLQEGARALQARTATPPCQILDAPDADTWGRLRPRSFPLHLHTLATSAKVHTWQRRGNAQCFHSTALVQAVRCAQTRATVLTAGSTRAQGLVQAPWQLGFRARHGAADAAPALAADVAPVLDTGGARADAAEAKPVGTILPLPRGTWWGRGEGAQQARAVPLAEHPALEVVKARWLDGTAPGRRRDGLKVGLVVEGGGMRGVVSGGALQAMHDLGMRCAPRAAALACCWGVTSAALRPASVTQGGKGRGSSTPACDWPALLFVAGSAWLA